MKKLLLFLCFISSSVIKLNAFNSVNEWVAICEIGKSKVSDYWSGINNLQKEELLVLLNSIIENYKNDMKKTNTEVYAFINTKYFVEDLIKVKNLRSDLANKLGINLLNFKPKVSILKSLDLQIRQYVSENFDKYNPANKSVQIEDENEEVFELNTANGSRSISIPAVSSSSSDIHAAQINLVELQNQQIIEQATHISVLNSENKSLEIQNKVCKTALAIVLTYNVARFGYNTLQANPKLAFVIKAAALISVVAGGYKYAQKKKWFESKD